MFVDSIYKLMITNGWTDYLEGLFEFEVIYLLDIYRAKHGMTCHVRTRVLNPKHRATFSHNSQ